jgi:hydrogenase maturation factor
MNVALSALASQQSKEMQQTTKDTVKFLHYCASHTDATIRYHVSDMILKLHSDVSYNSEPKACSRHFSMGNHNNEANDMTNGAILATTGVMKAVLSSASEAKIGTLFNKGKKQPSYK